MGRKRQEGPQEWAQGESAANACDRVGDCLAVATLLQALRGGPAPPYPTALPGLLAAVGVGGRVDNSARSATALPGRAQGLSWQQSDRRREAA